MVTLDFQVVDLRSHVFQSSVQASQPLLGEPSTQI
jgi:hypothetical protein